MEIWNEPVRGGPPDVSLFGMSGLEQMLATIRGCTPPPPIHHLTGLRPVDAGPGTATFTMPASPWFQSAAGMFLAGIQAFVADAPAGTAVFSTMPPATPVTTSELSLSFLRPATIHSGSLNARARLVHGGGSLGLSEVLVEDAHGRVLAHGSSRLFILPQVPGIAPPEGEPKPYIPVDYGTPDPYLRTPVVGQILEPEMRQKMSGLEISQAYANGDLEPAPWATLFGVRLVEVGEGLAVATQKVTGWLTSPAGMVYGGAIALLADATLLTSAYTTVPANTASATLDIKVQYLRPVWPGTELTARSRVVHRGKTMAVANCEITNSEGKKVALATGSTLIFPGRPVEPEAPVAPVDERTEQED